jgi:hypothetical protein
MWKVTIQCSAESWQQHAMDFKAIAVKYAGIPLSSKKMQGDESRVMEYQIENVSDAEDFIQACTAFPGFLGTFESL